jgi:predicted O-linked N-acetylglucosamine transferase (SPINDLY family)
MGAPYIDYLIADATVIPAGSERHYRESIIRLPESFMPYDGGRAIAAEGMSRAQCGLPEGGFVYCSFNKMYKLSPESFAGWMRILQRVPDSVLWLSAGNPSAVRNLRQAAAEAQVDARRILFADRLASHADHLARHRVADLFLDTLPYNAHATAADALWAGLPLLTRAGEAFAGRVAASLLAALGLPELIATTTAQYEDLAVDLAVNPSLLADLRRRLAANRLTAPLFDMRRLTRHLEDAFEEVLARRRAGELPRTFSVGPQGIT